MLGLFCLPYLHLQNLLHCSCHFISEERISMDLTEDPEGPLLSVAVSLFHCNDLEVCSNYSPHPPTLKSMCEFSMAEVKMLKVE